MEVDSPPTADNDVGTIANYIVSAQKPTVVNGCVVGNFRKEDTQDLIISRINRIEMLLLTEDGLKQYREIPVFGRIAVIQAFKPPNETLDSLLILTCKYHLAILSFDANGNCHTRASGSVSDKVARQSEGGILASIHRKTGLIALRLYDGLLKVVEWGDDKDLVCFNIRFGDSQITDFTFLEDEDSLRRPSIAYIYQDSNGRHLKVCHIDVNDKELQQWWRQDNIESESSLLIPVPNFYGGVVVVGQESISYHKNAKTYTAVAPPFIHVAQVCCYATVDANGERMLLGDVQGRLYMLVLITDKAEDPTMIKDIKIQLLGEISIPECMVYLDNSVVFIGSRLGDSQLIRVLCEPNEHDSFVELIDSFPNLGPIRDLVTIDIDGQKQIVTCSGAFKEGSLRVIRSGIGIEEVASIELLGIRHLFAFNLGQELDNYLLVSFMNVTHLFDISEEQWEDTTMDGLDYNSATLYAGILKSTGNLLQITTSAVNIVSQTRTSLYKERGRVTICAVNPYSGQILLATGEKLVYAQSDGTKIQTIAVHEFETEISCIDLSTIDENAPSRLAAVGLWDTNEVVMFSVSHELKQLGEPLIVGEVLSRSVVLTRMEEILYMLLSLADGTLFYFHVDEETGVLSEEKKTTLGTRPTLLRRFNTRNNTNIFACSDRPAVIFSSNQKLVFSNVNLKLVNEMCPLNSEHMPNSLALTDAGRLFIGVIDDIQKLHIRSVPLGEGVSRIAYQPETQTIAILTSRTESSEESNDKVVQPSISTNCTSHTVLPLSSSASTSRQLSEYEREQVDVYSVCILEATTFEVLHVCELPASEYAISLHAAHLGDSATPYYVVGTAYVDPMESEVKLGRVLVFSYDDKTSKMRLVQEKEVKGAVLAVETLHNKLVCAINSSVRLFAWTNANDLRLESTCFNFTTALHMKTKGDMILVGDLIRSVVMLSYKHAENQFEEVARDYTAEWTTCVEIIDTDTVIAGENAYNLYTCTKEVQGDHDDDRLRFEQNGHWYLGENVNVMRRGNLHSSNVNSNTNYKNPILYGTSDGGLGVIVQLPKKTFEYVEELQRQVAKNISNCMRVSYDEYRNFYMDRVTMKHAGFVDGDLIESLAEISRPKLAQIIHGMEQPPDSQFKGPATVEEVLRFVEEFSRIH
ncbi:hypothetical protein M3Y94_00974300 [Aphelenchoides besseyi]|nr:hypothetical protein M3Y94_00974300 [Aphelenchoides besseyi]KAI6224585.1 DNA damage-binding protein 1 [Aphelenchoides besseyi]